MSADSSPLHPTQSIAQRAAAVPPLRTLQQTLHRAQTVLLREDFNLPMRDGVVQHDARLTAALPTFEAIFQAGVRRIHVLSHLGRPKEGEFDASCSLAPLVPLLSERLQRPVHFVSYQDVHDLMTLRQYAVPAESAVVLWDNVRFWCGETACETELSRAWAQLADVFVMDAFACAHRKHASTYGVAQFARASCAGPLLTEEVAGLERILQSTEHPVLAIVGGAKISSKIAVLTALVEKVDTLIVGGGMANTFLVAAGFSVGESLYEPQYVSVARDILARARTKGVHVPLPVDAVWGAAWDGPAWGVKGIVEESANPQSRPEAQAKILDIGPQTVQAYTDCIQRAGTILWNGPLGVFENPAYAQGTHAVAAAVAQNTRAFSLAGGGDTLAALAQTGLSDRINRLSTGGGAFLAYIENPHLPGLAWLRDK